MVNKVERAIPAPYMNPLLAGILLGMVLLATFVVTGHWQATKCMDYLASHWRSSWSAYFCIFCAQNSIQDGRSKVFRWI